MRVSLKRMGAMAKSAYHNMALAVLASMAGGLCREDMKEDSWRLWANGSYELCAAKSGCYLGYTVRLSYAQKRHALSALFSQYGEGLAIGQSPKEEMLEGALLYGRYYSLPALRICVSVGPGLVEGIMRGNTIEGTATMLGQQYEAIRYIGPSVKIYGSAKLAPMSPFSPLGIGIDASANVNKHNSGVMIGILVSAGRM